MKTFKFSLTVLIVLSLLIGASAASGVITYQARVKTAAGADINGPVTVGFRVYGSLGGTTVLWGETQSLTATKGIISVELGKVNPLPAGIFNNSELYLGLTVSGDPEMAPRARLQSTWKAVSASRASGKMVQAGGETLTVSDTATASMAITFPKPFSSPPVVMLGAPSAPVSGVNFIPARVTDITTTGCTAHFTSLGGTAASGSANFDWIAVGE